MSGIILRYPGENKYNEEFFTGSEYDYIGRCSRWRLLKLKSGRVIEIDISEYDYIRVECVFIFKYEDGWYCVDINYDDGATATWICDQFDGLVKFLQNKLGDIL